jgi:hypothetical protein
VIGRHQHEERVHREPMRVEVAVGLVDGVREDTLQQNIHGGDDHIAHDVAPFPAIDDLLQVKRSGELLAPGAEGAGGVLHIVDVDEIVVGIVVGHAGITCPEPCALRSHVLCTDSFGPGSGSRRNIRAAGGIDHAGGANGDAPLRGGDDRTNHLVPLHQRTASHALVPHASTRLAELLVVPLHLGLNVPGVLRHLHR